MVVVAALFVLAIVAGVIVMLLDAAEDYQRRSHTIGPPRPRPKVVPLQEMRDRNKLNEKDW